MSTEFITLDSRLTFQRNAISERKLKPAGARDAYHFLIIAGVMIVACLYLYRLVVEQKYGYLIFFIILPVWLAPNIKAVYNLLFVRSWKNSIFLHEVRDVTTTPLDNGLETQVTLHLASGRKKTYVFRNAENQLNGFLQLFDLSGKTAISPA